MTKDKLCDRVGAGALAFAVAVRTLAGFGPTAEEQLLALAARPEVTKALLGLELGPVGQEIVFLSSAEDTAEAASAEQTDPTLLPASAGVASTIPEGTQDNEAPVVDADPSAEPSLSIPSADKGTEGGDAQAALSAAVPDSEQAAFPAVPVTDSTWATPSLDETCADSVILPAAVTQDPDNADVWVYAANPTEAAFKEASPTVADSAVDLSLLGGFNNQTHYDPDLEALLQAPVTLAGDGSDGPQVLIIHTHGTESYTPCAGDDYEETDPFHTLDESRNVTGLGIILAQTLQVAGIGVVHDRAYHDYPAYNGSYTRTAEDIRAILDRYPSIRLVIDLHRDSVQESDGAWTATAENEAAGAKLLLVVGTDAGGLENPDWENNLALALQVQARIGDESLCRGVNLRTERFNQQLAPTLLAELGACGDTWPQAEITARALGTAVAEVLLTVP